MVILSRRFLLFRKVNTLLDAVISGLSFLTAVLIRCYIDFGTVGIAPPYKHYLWLLFLIVPLFPFLLTINGLYPTDRLRTPAKAAGIILKSTFQGILILLALIFVLKILTLSLYLFLDTAILFSVPASSSWSLMKFWSDFSAG